MNRNALGYLDREDLGKVIDEVRIIKRCLDEKRYENTINIQAFGSEDLTDMRKNNELNFVFNNIRTSISEAVKYIYYTGDPRRRNVRIRNNYKTIDYWDGMDWWMMGIYEAVVTMSGLAVQELEHCIDWSEELSDQTKEEFDKYMLEYNTSEDLQESVKAQIIENMIRPFPQVKD